MDIFHKYLAYIPTGCLMNKTPQNKTHFTALDWVVWNLLFLSMLIIYYWGSNKPAQEWILNSNERILVKTEASKLKLSSLDGVVYIKHGDTSAVAILEILIRWYHLVTHNNIGQSSPWNRPGVDGGVCCKVRHMIYIITDIMLTHKNTIRNSFYSLFTLRKPRSPLILSGEWGFLRVNRL